MPSKAKAKAKAHCFWVLPREGTAAEVERLLKAFADKKKIARLTDGPQPVLVGEPHWRTHAGTEAFTASAFRVRSSALPSVVGSSGVTPLELAQENGLGEPTCFALDPTAGVALVLSSANGPRHSVIASLLRELGFPHDLDVEPVLRADMAERLSRINFSRSIEFGIRDVRENRNALAEAGETVEKAIEVAESLGGVSVRVVVTVGAQKAGLTLGTVKMMSEALRRLGTSSLSRLTLTGSEAEDQKCETLDLLNARVEVELDLAEDSREMDREHCQRQLIRALAEVIPGTLKQKPLGP